MDRYCKRLIEVDLPIKRISAHSRREKSIRHGHISTLHIWWARRPLAACRAVICAALWPDPADELCPPAFRDKAREKMLAWTSHDRQQILSPESRVRFEKARQKPALFDDAMQLRGALLDFIADFANWDNSTVREYLDTSRGITQAAHEALGGAPGTRPLVVDPFAGGGSIPLEALRVGADAFASDLNPVAVLLNRVVLEYIPKYGQRLADEVRKWGEWIKREAEKELAEFYPKDADGATPIAYLWARTIQCEGPGCGAEVPLIRSLWLAKKANRSVALQLVPNKKAKRIDFQVIFKQRDGWADQINPKTKIETPKLDGPVKRGSATCPCCGYTTPVARVREQLKAHQGGAQNSTLFCIVASEKNTGETIYRAPRERDLDAGKRTTRELETRAAKHEGQLSLVPDEYLPVMSGVFNAPIYGHSTWGSLFTARQALMLSTYGRLVRELRLDDVEEGLATATRVLLALTVSKLASFSSSLCIWRNVRTCVAQTFGRQALPMVWDFGEMNPFAGSAGDFTEAVDYLLRLVDHIGKSVGDTGHCEQADAAASPLPSDSASLVATDPPYYNAVPYADLSDFFYVWLKRMLFKVRPQNFATELTPKPQEICEMSGWDPVRYPEKDGAWFEKRMSEAMVDARRVASPESLGVVVFAHKTTSGWEAQLQAIIQAGWVITGSWPIDTERSGRLRAHDSAALASSIHLVCRPRENPDGSVRTDEIGDWRDVLAELPRRINEWMPRLAEEGVVGADAIFACLGPALEIFSRYSRVEKVSGETVTLKEYLVEVWAAVAKEALTMVFEGADASGFEADARLTAMWLWTLNAGATEAANDEGGEEEEPNDDSEGNAKKAKTSGYVLEYDAARKIAQGLGAHLEDLSHLVEIKGDTATLLPVGARTRYLFGKEAAEAPKGRKKKKESQLKLALDDELKEIEEESKDWDGELAGKAGVTVLDQLHQSMILFAAGRGEAVRRFLVEDGAGHNPLFWRLAQAMSALYPSSTDEKRWVDGVLARKKGLGL